MEERYGSSTITVSTTVEEQAFRPALRCKTNGLSAPVPAWIYQLWNCSSEPADPEFSTSPDRGSAFVYCIAPGKRGESCHRENAAKTDRDSWSSHEKAKARRTCYRRYSHPHPWPSHPPVKERFVSKHAAKAAGCAH